MTKCLLCRSTKNDELWLGKMYIRRNGNAVHENCLYLSSNLVQRGQEGKDICCFTLTDIKAESQRTQLVKCCYCNKTGANIGCCAPRCQRSFHTVCGLKNGAQNQYCRTYKSFCNLHIEKFLRRPSKDQKCAICMDILVPENGSFQCIKYILGKCCNRGWYHKRCLQQYANSAGYFFKCPLCNDTSKFRLVSLWGINVPNRDASWEETDAYDGELEIPTHCTAETCHFGDNRESDQLLYCNLCGGNPMHVECTSFMSENYRCNDCNGVDKHESMSKVDVISFEEDNDEAMKSAPQAAASICIDELDSDDLETVAVASKVEKKETITGITPLRGRNCSPRAQAVEMMDSGRFVRNICMPTGSDGEENSENMLQPSSFAPTPNRATCRSRLSRRLSQGPLAPLGRVQNGVENTLPAVLEAEYGVKSKVMEEGQTLTVTLFDSDIDDLEIAVALFNLKREGSCKVVRTTTPRVSSTIVESIPAVEVKQPTFNYHNTEKQQEDINVNIQLAAQLKPVKSPQAVTFDANMPKLDESPQPIRRQTRLCSRLNRRSLYINDKEPDEHGQQHVEPDAAIARGRQSRLRPSRLALAGLDKEHEQRAERANRQYNVPELRPQRLRRRRGSTTEGRLEKEKTPLPLPSLARSRSRLSRRSPPDTHEAERNRHVVVPDSPIATSRESRLRRRRMTIAHDRHELEAEKQQPAIAQNNVIRERAARVRRRRETIAVDRLEQAESPPAESRRMRSRSRLQRKLSQDFNKEQQEQQQQQQQSRDRHALRARSTLRRDISPMISFQPIDVSFVAKRTRSRSAK